MAATEAQIKEGMRRGLTREEAIAIINSAGAGGALATPPSPYEVALEQYADTAYPATPVVPPTGGAHGQAAFSYVTPEQPAYNVGARTGAYRFKNGVIADPATNFIEYPPNDPSVVGSPTWLRKIQDSWSKEKVNEWRKKLTELGYQPEGGLAAKGPMGYDLIEALKLYHNNRYLNAGNVLPAGGTPVEEERERYKDVTSDAELVQRSRGVLTQMLGDNWSEEQADFLASKMEEEVRRRLRKRVPGDAAFMKGTAKAEEEFREEPETQLFLNQQDDIERNTTLKDSLISVAQMISGLG